MLLITCCSAKDNAVGAWVVLCGPRGVSRITWVGVDKAGFNQLLVPYQHPLLSLFPTHSYHACYPHLLHLSRMIAPFTHFSLFSPLFRSLTHIPSSRPVTSLFILIFRPSPCACTRDIQPARRISFFSSFSDHVIDHLIAMCLPHGLVVTDPIAPSQSVLLFGFHVCPLLETKHGLCAVRL